MLHVDRLRVEDLEIPDGPLSDAHQKLGQEIVSEIGRVKAALSAAAITFGVGKLLGTATS